jgi:hypothetical protein
MKPNDKTMLKNQPEVVLTGLLLLAASASDAAMLAHEPFTNASGTVIIGSSAGFGFISGWQSNNSQGTATNTDYGLSYTDGASHTLVTAGGAGFFQGPTTANNNLQPIRLFNFSRGTNGTDGVTTWISFLVARQGPLGTLAGNPFGRGANVPHDLNAGALQKLAIGNGSGATSNTVALIPQGSGANIKGATNVFGGVTNFVVVRVDHVLGGNDVAYLFVNPELNVEPAISAAGAVSSNSFDFSFDRLRVFAGGQSSATQPYAELILDEYRLGETYADVTPYVNGPPQAVAGLVITNVQFIAGNILLAGTGGSSSGAYHLLANADPGTAATNWATVATNNFDPNGNFALSHPAGVGGQFYRLCIPAPPPPIRPSILTPPMSLTVTQGQTAVFDVVADGTAPLSFQWCFNTNTVLSGQTATHLSIANAQVTNAGAYSVRISNSGGSVTSVVATLTVLQPPAITTPPQSQTVLVSNNVMFSVVASGTAPLSYQWFFNTNAPIPEATNATHSIPGVSTNDAGAYSVLVSNDYGSTNSVPALLTVSVPNTSGDCFVSPAGSDLSPGTMIAPFATLNKAISVVQPGQTIFMRGGTYLPSATIRITNSGTANARIQLFAYPGETPYLNFTNQPYGANNRGILFPANVNYWTVKGLEIGFAGDNGIKVEGSHHRFELCVFHHNGDTGLQIGFGHDDVNPGGQLAAFIEVVNCDSYLNYDPDSNGGDADGFAAKMHCGQGIGFTGCRAWENSDDGWDLFETDYSVVISNCWTWRSGVAQGNGNGFKLGGNGAGGDSKGTHYAYNSVAFGHKVNGFTQNSHKDGVVVINCLSFTNGSSGYNYFMEGSLNSGKQNVFKNNVGIRRNPASSSNNFIEDNLPLEQNNSWNLAVTPNLTDYVSLLETAAKAPRQPDGSLPSGFARLAAGSDLIDQGVNVGQPFNGSAPDLGPYEYQ